MIPYSRYLVYPIPWYSVLILTGVVLAIVITSRLEKRESLPQDTVIELALWIIPFGILGARLYYVLFSWNTFRDDLFSVFRVWEGGLAVYGGILTGFVVILIFCHYRCLSVLTLCDIIVPGLALAQAIGRWGNYFNMEAYGRPVENPSLWFFPFAVYIPSSGGSGWYLATFFYESCCDFTIFVILLTLRRRYRLEKGDLLCFYVLFYAAVRTVIEELREDSLYSGSVRISQLLSILAVLSMIVIILWRFLRFLRPGDLPKPALPLGVLLILLAAFTVGYSVKLPALNSCTFPCSLVLLAGFSFVSVVFYLLLFFSLFRQRRNICLPQD